MRAFLRQNFRWIVGGFLLTYCSSFGQTFFVSASIAEWQEKFDLTYGAFGRLYMMATLGSALVLPFVGKIVDVIEEYKVVAFIAPLLALAMIGAAYAPSILVLTISIFFLRLFGQGMMTHIALTATGRWFSAQRGRAVSLVVLGHQGGEATLPLIFAMLSLAIGYQAGWALLACGFILLVLPIALWAYHKPRIAHGKNIESVSPVRSWTRAEVLRDPVFWILLSGVLAPPFIGTTLFFHQDYMTSINHWPPQAFATAMTLMAFTTVIFALINGALSDRFGARRILPFFLLPLAAACFTASFGGSLMGLYVFMTLLGISYGFSSTLFGALWPEVYGTDHLGAVRSVIVSAMVLATALGPGITGTLIDWAVPLRAQLVYLGFYCLFGAAMLTFAASQLRQRQDQAPA